MCIISKQTLATVTLLQPELSKATASLSAVYLRQCLSPTAVSSQGIGKMSACQVPIGSAFSSSQERRQQLEGRSLQQPCQMPAMFIEENARIPGSPERGLLLRVSERWENMTRIQRCSGLVLGGKNDFWCPYIGVNYKSLTSPTAWSRTSKEVLRLVSGFCDKWRQRG